MLDIERRLFCNFAKKIKGRNFMGHSGTDFQLLLNSKSSKFPSHSLLKNMLKIPILGPKEKGPFFQILL